MKIALVEPSMNGHHEVYLKSFYSVLKEMGHSPMVYTTKGLKTIKIKQIRYKNSFRLPSNFLLKKCAVVLNLLVVILNLWNLRICLKKDKSVDLVFFCCIDDYMNEMMTVSLFNCLFPFYFSALLLSPRSRKIYYSFDRRNILRSKYCLSIAVLDEFCAGELSKFQSNIIHFPDFADESSPNDGYFVSNLILSKAKKRKIVSLLGAISRRKGIYTFVDTAKLMSSENYFFVLAGKSFLDTEAENYLQENFANRENCFFFKEGIPTEADFNKLVSISDILYAAYIDFTQSSNMFAKASLFKKPLIVSKGFYMEEIILKYDFGIAINQNSAKECADAIRFLILNSNENKDGYIRYLRNNSYDNLKDSFCKLFSNECL